MFDSLNLLFQTDFTRALVVTISSIIILGLMVWVSIIDIKKQSVTFWKMLVVSFSTILFPFIASFFCYCKYLKFFIIGAVLLWVFLLFLNVKFNKDKFVGKADFDLISALISLCVTISIWMFVVLDPNIVWIRITALWYSFFLYLLFGALIYIGVYLFIVTFNVLKHKTTFRESLRNKKVSVLPMFIPVAVLTPYMIMIL